MMRKSLLSILLTVFMCVQLFAQDKTVSGKVTSSDDGSPLPGVNVSVKGTSRGTTTSSNGTYKITVSGNATLVFTFVGFEARQVSVGNRSTVDVQ
jgi:hypothetical protein